MGLPEPVSGSHVASALGPVSGSPHIPPPPYYSSPLQIVAPSYPASVNPRSSEPPPPPPVLLSDPALATALAPSSGAVPPPVTFPRPDLAPDHCRSISDPSSSSIANPATVHSSPPNTNRPRAVPDPSPPAGPFSVPASSSSSGPVLAASPAPATRLASCPPLHPCSSADPFSFPPLSASTNPISPISASPSPHSSSIGPDPPPQQSHVSILASDPHMVHPHAHNNSSNTPALPLLTIPPSSLRADVSHKPSYAQATRSGRGSGFVRSHAAAVDHFARVPRTGAKIICGSREGVPSFSFVSSDLPKVEEIYSNALVMKFAGGRPSLEASQQEIISWGMEQSFSIGPLSSRAFLLRFQDDRDLLKVLTRPSSILITFPYKIYRWHNLCHLTEDSSMAPVWISLPRLPMQCFIPEFLEAVGNKLGRFLCFDRATTTLARPSVARICVELDLRKSLPPSIWVGLFEGFKQPIIYERLPKFCNLCHRLGHANAVCSKPCTVAREPVDEGHPAMLKDRTPPVRDTVASVCPWGQRETLPTQAHPRPDPGPGHPPAARRNASKRSSSKSQITFSSVSFNSSHTPHPQTSTAPSTLTEPPHSKHAPLNVAEITPPTQPPSTQDSADPPSVLNHVSQPPLTYCSHSEEQLQPMSVQGLCHGSPSTMSASLKPSLLEASRAAQLPSAAPPLSHPADPAQVHPPILAESQLVSPTKSKTKTRKIKAKKKSVSFKLPGQSNLSANVDYWSAVNNQISNIDQNHTYISNKSIPLNPSAVPTVDNPHHPSIHPTNPNISTSAPPSTWPSDKQKRIIATFDTSKIHPALWEAVNRQISILDQAHVSGSPVVQSLLNSCRATVPNPPVSIPSTSNTNLYTMSPSTSDSESSIAADYPPYSHGSQYDAFSLKPASYKSEGEDSGTEEARLQGHFSDDMSSAKPKSSRKNKRHPDQPLNVQLRARKGGGY